ncbi:hypothetical protein INT47_002645 [Mucor saturninus]|uniref:SET domain-containing protein n=1 Tax=Mucor saturninus TaxID=64648 RepID=A0A8H7R8G1_9FUNG|nr:hypothetical protein INT47_002645 [Mucor saturninus]
MEDTTLKRKRGTSIQPRWYNQAYLLFLALRQHPENSLPRIQLIDAAIELDKKIGVELQLPRVFRGKTPKNSASATLTNNSDRYFIAFKPEGSKSTHFKLAYTPGNVGDAVKEYNSWCTKLVEHDWPFCFGVPKQQIEPHYHTPVSHTDDSDSIDAMDKDLVHLKLHDQSPSKIQPAVDSSIISQNGEDKADTVTIETAEIAKTTDVETENIVTDDTHINKDMEDDSNTEEGDHTMEDPDSSSNIGTPDPNQSVNTADMSNITDTPDADQNTDISVADPSTDIPVADQSTNTPVVEQSTDTLMTDQGKNSPVTDQSANTPVADQSANISDADASNTNSTDVGRKLNVQAYIEQMDTQDESAKPTRPKKQPIPPEPFITLEQLDLSNIPQSWRDIVRVAPSRIPFGGNGLFAKRKLPYNTPIGFYFGVPMTEDEFDSLKDRVGRSSEYSIMYRRTVLDATDDEGQPITDEDSPRFCPFHYMNETSSQKTASVAFVEGAIVNQIICWTKKDIEEGEELLVWYGKDVHRYWTEEEEEANRKKEHKESKVEKTRLVQERKMDRLLQRQERERALEEKKKRKELMKLDKLEQERIKKLKRQENKKTKKVVVQEEELLVPEKGQLIIVDESGAFFSQDELDQQRLCTTQPMKDIILVNYSE